MSETAAQAFTTESGLYPIRTVSDLTGVNSITLRAWERRHGLLEPIRRPSGHRLYTQEHIDLINRVVGLLDRGMRIGQVQAHLAANVDDKAGGSVWQSHINHMIAAVIRFDERALEETYGEALAIHPAEEVTERLLKPLLVELGRRWEVGEGSIAEEHFFAFYLRNKLGARFHHRVVPTRGPKVLMACLPGDRHETGLLLFALAANNAGLQAILLGADMPLEELPAAVRKTGCVAIVLSGFMTPAAAVLDTQLAELVASCAVPVFVGGRASVAAHDALKRAGAHPLGTALGAGVDRIRQALDDGGPERKAS